MQMQCLNSKQHGTLDGPCPICGIDQMKVNELIVDLKASLNCSCWVDSDNDLHSEACEIHRSRASAEEKENEFRR